MSGKRKAKAMSASEPEKKSKKTRLAEARANAAKFAARDKAKVQNARAKKAGSPVKKATKPPKTPQAKKSPAKQTPKSERRKVARENALKFAAKDQAKLKSKKKATPSKAQVDDVPPPVPETLSGTAIDRTQVEAFEEMRERLMRQDAPSESGSEEIDDEDDIAPPPPALMAQVSTQVLLNARKAQAADSNSISSEEADEAIANDNIDVESIDGSDKPKGGFLQKMALLVVVAVIIAPALAIASMMVVLPSPEIAKKPSIGEKVVPKKPLCYFDSNPIPIPDPDDNETEIEVEESCSNVDGVPCPKGGVCEGGLLIGCDNIFQDVSEQKDECVLGDDFVPMRDALMDLLVSHASKICNHSVPPAFPYAELQKEQPTVLEEESDDLVAALVDEGFVISETSDGLFVGLPEGFEVNLPLYCHLGNYSQLAFQEFGFLLLGVLSFIGSNLWGLVSTYPLPTLLFLILLGCAVKIRNYFAAKKKRQELLVYTRKIAYKTLEDNPGKELVALHIRDAIANDNYADDKKAKFEFQKYVWPKIVSAVKRDTRVRKSQTIDQDGKPRDVWQWTAASKS